MKRNFTVWVSSALALVALPLITQTVKAQCTVPAPGESTVELTIETQGFATEVYWQLKDNTTAIIASTTAGTYPTNNTTYGPTFLPQHQLCLINNATYDFEAYDSFGDSWNGGTYSWNSGCDGSLIINNGGASPQNAQQGFFPNDLEVTEQMTIIPTFPTDVRVEAILSPVNGCEGVQDVQVVVCNGGSDNQVNIPITWQMDTITFADTITDTLFFCGDCDTITLGTVDLDGLPAGWGYDMGAWTALPGDSNLLNDSILNDSVFIYANTGGSQSITYSPSIVMPDVGTFDVDFFVCNDWGTVDSCLYIDEVYVDANHTWAGDMEISLVSPQGTVVDLSSNNGGTGDDYPGVGFSDFASLPITSQTFGIIPGTYLPEQPLNTFYGETSQGKWTVRFEDNGTFGPTTINEVSITFTDANPNPGYTDSTNCSGMPFVINVGSPSFATYAWDDGTTGPTKEISESGEAVHSVTTTDVNGVCTSSIDVTIRQGYSADLGDDREICSNEDYTVALDPNNFVSATWAGGGTANGLNYTVDAVGTYTVDATDIYGCVSMDDFLITAVNQAPVVDLGDDVVDLCEGEFVLLDAGTGFNDYSWSNGAVGQSQIAVTSAIYTVVVTDNSGCTGDDNVQVNVNPIPNQPLPAPSFAEPNTVVTLPGGAWASYFWTYNGTFATTQDLTFTVPLYGTTVTLEVTSDAGCVGTSDTYYFNYPLSVDEQEEGTIAVFPNPNNGQFTIRNNGDRETVSIQVLDLTGKLVFGQNNLVLDAGMDFPVNLENVATGAYLLNLVREDKVEQVKLIVE